MNDEIKQLNIKVAQKLFYYGEINEDCTKIRSPFFDRDGFYEEPDKKIIWLDIPDYVGDHKNWGQIILWIMLKSSSMIIKPEFSVEDITPKSYFNNLGKSICNEALKLHKSLYGD